jgi:serine/threonine protein kinase
VNSAPQGVSKADTQTDAVLGSPEYMSPEQCRGDRAIDAKADIYSLGVMMFRMLAGRLPFQAESIGALMGMHIYEQPPDLNEVAPELPVELAQLIKRMLVKDPASRPTAIEVQQAVEQLFTRLGGRMTSISLSAVRSDVGAELPSDGGRGSTLASATGQTAANVAPARRSKVLPVALGLLALGLVGGGAAVLLLRPKPPVEKPAVKDPSPADKDRDKGKQAMPPLGREGPPPVVVSPLEGKKAPATWSIETEPPGAQVVRVSDGQILGTTPWKGPQTPGDEPVAVRLRLAGYSDKVLTLKPGADASYLQVLRARSGKKGGKNRQDGKTNEPEIAD